MAFGMKSVMKEAMLGDKSKQGNVPFGKKQGPFGKNKDTKGPAKSMSLSARLMGKK
jgi:hypothetical protein